MKKVELLSPAGSFDALRSAVQNGCDAVYLGGRMFGARAFANNFDNDELKKAVAYAHIYDVRVFVTVNTLLYEEELETFKEYAIKLQEADVDALIVQDMGAFVLLKKLLPDMELHASTQMHIHNPDGILMMKEEGASRVVVPRETSIEQIREYAKLGLDLEVFVQGALCVSYSGQCLMSSQTLDRSGNQGECAQNCRMQYTLEKEEAGIRQDISTKGSYLLSCKDLNTLEEVPKLIEAGIASFKIEGRMKRPEYVALMTSLYRKAIDAYYEKKEFHVDKEMKEEMQKIFHRGFTKGHLFHQMGSALMNPVRPNHIGIEIGVVENVYKGKMTIRLHHDLAQGDGIRILSRKEDAGFCANRIYKDGLLVNKAYANDRIQMDVNTYVEKGSKVLKTSDILQLEKLRQSFEKGKRKVEISGQFFMHIGQPVMLIVEDGIHKVEIASQCVCELARKTALDADRIQTQLRKTNNTPFRFHEIALDIDAQGIFPISELNRMRREALSTLEELRKNRNGNRRVQLPEFICSPIQKREELLVVISNKKQYEICKEMGISNVYVEDENLYRQLHKIDEHVYKREPRVMKEEYEAYTMIQENGGMYHMKHGIGDTSLNITNSLSAGFAFSHGLDIVTLSIEHDESSIEKLCTGFEKHFHQKGNFALQVYGHVELMLSEYCPINAYIKDNNKQKCALCRGNIHYALRDKKGHRYPLMNDSHCRMHLLSEEPINICKDIPKYKQFGITSFLCVFTIEDETECRNVLRNLLEVYDA